MSDTPLGEEVTVLNRTVFNPRLWLCVAGVLVTMGILSIINPALAWASSRQVAIVASVSVPAPQEFHDRSGVLHALVGCDEKRPRWWWMKVWAVSSKDHNVVVEFANVKKAGDSPIFSNVPDVSSPLLPHKPSPKHPSRIEMSPGFGMKLWTLNVEWTPNHTDTIETLQLLVHKPSGCDPVSSSPSPSTSSSTSGATASSGSTNSPSPTPTVTVTVTATPTSAPSPTDTDPPVDTSGSEIKPFILGGLIFLGLGVLGVWVFYRILRRSGQGSRI